MQQVEKDELQEPYLGEVEPHLFAVEVGLVESQSRLSGGQSVTETDPDPPERLEVLELHLRVERAEQAFETGLKKIEGEDENEMMTEIRRIRPDSAPSPPVPLNLVPSALLIYKY